MRHGDGEVLIVTNPRSGMVDRRASLSRGIEMLRAAGARVATLTLGSGASSGLHDALARLPPRSIVAAAGGDGTVNMVAQALRGGGHRLLPLAMGTFNHFARHLGIPSDPAEALQLAVTGSTEFSDVGEANGRVFVNMSVIGAYTDVITARERYRKRGWHKVPALVRAGAAGVWAPASVSLVLARAGETVHIKTPFLFVGNGSFAFAGLDMFSNRSSTLDGRLLVAVANETGILRRLGMITNAFFGRLPLDPYFNTVGLTAFSVEAPNPFIAVGIDGEIERMQTPIRYRILPKALPVVVPAGAG